VAHASLSKGTRNACPAGFLRGLDLQTDVLLIITDDGHVFESLRHVYVALSSTPTLFLSRPRTFM
jgi:hypothetical protein